MSGDVETVKAWVIGERPYDPDGEPNIDYECDVKIKVTNSNSLKPSQVKDIFIQN